MRRSPSRLILITCFLVVLCGMPRTGFSAMLPGRTQSALAESPVGVLTQHNDNSRTGANLNETILNTSDVNVAQFGKVFERDVDGQIVAQPLYVPNLLIPGQGVHNVVIVATMHDTVYAFDADNPQEAQPLWSVSLGSSVLLPNPCIGPMPYTDISVEVGILSTPVIDLSTNTLYIVAATQDNNGPANCNGYYFSHHLHALDLTTGQERPGSPVLIQASVPGKGMAAVNGVISFVSYRQDQRSSLTLANHTVYFGFASYGDQDPYHGWIFGYDETTLQQVALLCTTPNGAEGGVWMSGQGLLVDSAGNLYAAVANGSWTAGRPHGTDYGDSFIKLSPSLTIEDWFTPYNQAYLKAQDLDVGSIGVLALPGTTRFLGGDKNGSYYLLDEGSLGHYQATSNSQIPQSFPGGEQSGYGYGSPAYYNGQDGPTVYIWNPLDLLRAFSYNTASGLFNPQPVQVNPTYVANYAGGGLSISANGSTPGSGILWAAVPIGAQLNYTLKAGALFAFDASNINHILWSSLQNPARDTLGYNTNWAAPTVANGRVYVPTFSDKLAVYGLLPSLALSASPTNPVVGQPVTLTASVSAIAPLTGIPTGSISFIDQSNDTATTLGTANLDATGNATFTTSSLAHGLHTLQAVYSGDATFPGSLVSLNLSVNYAPDVVSLNAVPLNPTLGQSVTLTANVSAAAPGQGVPTGNIIFTDQISGTITTLGTVNLDATGTATFTVSNLAHGSHVFNALYSGDSTFAARSASFGLRVSYNPDTVSLSASTTRPVLGQPVTLTANVSALTTGLGIPTGNITFTDQISGTTGILGTASLDATGTATFTLSNLAHGSHVFNALYSGDGTFAARSASFGVGVSYNPDTVSLSASPTRPVLGQPVTLTANVGALTTGLGIPTGNITFTDQISGTTGILGTVGLDATGTATFTVSNLAHGSHVFNALYSGDDTFAARSASFGLRVSYNPDTVSLSASTTRPVLGQPVTLTANVGALTTGLGIPTGNITFTDQISGTTSILGTVNLDATGTATFTVSNPVHGSHVFNALYSGDHTFAARSASLGVGVSYNPDTVSLSASTTRPVLGQPVTLTANVSALTTGLGVPTGSITFTDQISGTTSILGTVSLDATGTATFTVSNLAHGSHVFNALYSGDDTFAARSASLGVGVSYNPDTVSLSASTTRPVLGQPVTLTANVSALTTGLGIPTGNITFTDQISGTTSILGTVGLDATGTATFTVSNPVHGSHVFNALYSGDDTFAARSASLGVGVSYNPDTVSLSASTTRPVLGQPVTLTANVSALTTGLGIPTGNITFIDQSKGVATTLGTASLDATGTATFTLSNLAHGSHVFNALYSGDGTFAARSASFGVGVSYNPDTVSLSASPSRPVLGQPVTLTANVGALTTGLGIPTGNITFTDQISGTTGILGTVGLDATGTATFTVSNLAHGSHVFNALYSGDSTFAARSASLGVGVSYNPDTVSLSASPTRPVLGQPVTLTTDVSAVAPGTGIPTGSITFIDQSNGTTTTLGTVQLNPNGQATFTTNLGPGRQSLQAVYSGDTTFAGRTTSLILTVVPGSATPTPTNTVTATQPATSTITPTATVTDTATSTPTATGTASATGTLTPTATPTVTATP